MWVHWSIGGVEGHSHVKMTEMLVGNFELNTKRPVYTGDFVAATQCNFCRAEVATSHDYIAFLVQFVSANISTRLFLKQKLCACSKVKLILKVTVFRELYLILRR